MSPEEIADKVAERGRGFEMTADATRKLRSLGFRPAQVDIIKDASDEPLLPGKWLTTSDSQRDETYKEIELVTARSGAAIKPIQSQHVTLWAAKAVQQMYLSDVKKLEKFFHTKCAEPIRSGLDTRSTHIVLLKDHAEYEAWARAMFNLFGEQFEQKDNPGANAHVREELLKLSAFYWWDFCAISLGDLSSDFAHRHVVCGLGGMYFSQLAKPPQIFGFGSLETGFINGAETAVFGSPSIMFSAIAYGVQTRHPDAGRQDWGLPVRQRMATNRATPLGELLQMDTAKMLQPHYAEAWMLVELLNKQPAKFGELLLEIRKGKGGSDLEAIEKVYGWDEKTLTKKWRAYVMAQRN
jgi:hypothetical protein